MLRFLKPCCVVCQTTTELVREEPGTRQTKKRMDIVHCSSDKQTHAGVDKREGKNSPGMTAGKN